jgi:hypothetical protein
MKKLFHLTYFVLLIIPILSFGKDENRKFSVYINHMNHYWDWHNPYESPEQNLIYILIRFDDWETKQSTLIEPDMHWYNFEIPVKQNEIEVELFIRDKSRSFTIEPGNQDLYAAVYDEKYFPFEVEVFSEADIQPLLYREKTHIEGRLALPETVGPDFPKNVDLFLPFMNWGNLQNHFSSPVKAEIDWRSAKFEFDFHSVTTNLGFIRLQNRYYPIITHPDEYYESNWEIDTESQILIPTQNESRNHRSRAQKFLHSRYPKGLAEDDYLRLVNAFVGDLSNRTDTLMAWSRAIADYYDAHHSDPEDFLTYINQIGRLSHKDLFEEAYNVYTDHKESEIHHDMHETEAMLTTGLLIAFFFFGCAVVLKIIGFHKLITPQRFDFVEVLLIIMIGVNLLFHGLLHLRYRVIEVEPFFIWALCISMIVVFYLNQRFFVPGFLLKKKWIPYAALVVGSSIALFLFSSVITFTPLHDYRLFFIEESWSWQLFDSYEAFYDGPHGEDIFVIHLFLLLIAPIYGLGRYFVFRGMPRLKMQKEALNAELNNLKTQISPHFFFNSLNTVYGFALGEDSPKTAEAITKMSNLMRFAIYHGDKDFIPLETELDYLADYIELQRLRLNPMRHNLSFEIEGEPKNQQIAPLLLITLVENAFKHGISMSHDSYIYIDLFIQENGLILTVENSVHQSQKVLAGNDRKMAVEGGIGLTNTKQRLELLYPGKYDWQIEESDEHYMARLSLDL